MLAPSRPRVASVLTPRLAREYWQAQRRAASLAEPHLAGARDPHDIQQIEAVVPACLLYSFPAIFSHCLWLHFVDNNGALNGLVKGSASVMADEGILGYTWDLIAQRRVWAYCDRADTDSNIADLPSRCRLVQLGDPFGLDWVPCSVRFPPQLLASLGDSLRGASPTA